MHNHMPHRRPEFKILFKKSLADLHQKNQEILMKKQKTKCLDSQYFFWFSTGSTVFCVTFKILADVRKVTEMLKILQKRTMFHYTYLMNLNIFFHAL